VAQVRKTDAVTDTAALCSITAKPCDEPADGIGERGMRVLRVRHTDTRRRA